MTTATIDNVPRIIAWLNVERGLRGEAPVDYAALTHTQGQSFSGQQAVTQGLASAKELYAALADQAKARMQAVVTDWLSLEMQALQRKTNPAAAITPLSSEPAQLWLAAPNPDEPPAIAASVAAANMADVIVRAAVAQPAMSDADIEIMDRGIKSAQAILHSLTGVQPQGPEEMAGFKAILTEAVILATKKAAMPANDVGQYLAVRGGEIDRQIGAMRSIAAATRPVPPEQGR